MARQEGLRRLARPDWDRMTALVRDPVPRVRGSSLVQIWFRLGSGPLQVWFRSGSGLVQVWLSLMVEFNGQ